MGYYYSLEHVSCPYGDIIIIIIFIIIIINSFMQGIYTYIPETNHVTGEYRVSAILSLLFMVTKYYYYNYYYYYYYYYYSPELGKR